MLPHSRTMNSPTLDSVYSMQRSTRQYVFISFSIASATKDGRAPFPVLLQYNDGRAIHYGSQFRHLSRWAHCSGWPTIRSRRFVYLQAHWTYTCPDSHDQNHPSAVWRLQWSSRIVSDDWRFGSPFYLIRTARRKWWLLHEEITCKNVLIYDLISAENHSACDLAKH